MQITVQNYKQLRPSFDLSKLPKAAKEPFDLIDNDFDDYLELYTDSDPSFNDIRTGVDNHIKIINKYLIDAPKKVDIKKGKRKLTAFSRSIFAEKYENVEKKDTNNFISGNLNLFKYDSAKATLDEIKTFEELKKVEKEGYVVVKPKTEVKPTKAVVIDSKKPISKEAFKKKMVKVIDDKLAENKKQSSSTKPKSIKTASNLVILQVRNKQGDYIGVLSHEHDNTKEKMRSMNAYLRMKASEDFGSEFSNINSATGVTDKNGKPIYVISPNGRSIVKANTKDADYILGNWTSSSVIKKQTSSTKPKSKTKPNKVEQKTNKKESPCDDAIDNYLEKKKEARAKASAKNKRARIKEALDKENVNFYNSEFRLLRRFKNLVTKKGVVSFRSVQLLYIAFQKHAVARKVRKTSELANLYEICNKKLNKIYEAIAPTKQSANITFSDTDVLEQLKKLVDNKKVDYAITLLNKVINVQGTAPEDAKVQRIISSIENGFKNGRVDERSRLYDDLIKAKSNLQKYIDDKAEKIPTVNYGLSGVKKKECLCHKGLNGKTNNRVVLEVPPVIVNQLPVEYIEITKGIGLNDVEKKIETNFENINKTDDKISENTNLQVDKIAKKPPLNKFKKSKNVLSGQELMNMTFDTIKLPGIWDDFMQDPARRMLVNITGKPKNGKTSGAMAFANMLTDFGTVLYNFADQGVNPSTQKLWKLSGLQNKSNAYLTANRDIKELDKLCASGNYDYVFIDMINTYIDRFKIKPSQFDDMFKQKYPNISFINIFEVTKGGVFKGDQGWEHLPDQLVNVSDFLMESSGRYGVGHYVVWKQEFKKRNPKKYNEIFEDEQEESIKQDKLILEV